MKKGKPISHDKSQIEVIIERFANSEKLCNLFNEFKIDRSTFNRKIQEFDLHTTYARARELHGDGFNDEIESIKEDLKNGVIDYSVARVLIDTVKWQACKFYPRMYGDKLDVTSDGQKMSTVINLLPSAGNKS